MLSYLNNWILIWLVIVMPIRSANKAEIDPLDAELASADRWVYRQTISPMDFNYDDQQPCASVHPLSRDIVKRFYAVLPYFRKDNSESIFLHKYRSTLYRMSESDDIMNREAAFYVTVLTPIMFLQNYRDTWCLLERFHRSFRMFFLSHPQDKRHALKILQNIRPVNQKIRDLILNLPGTRMSQKSTKSSELPEEDIHDQKEIRFVKELIKNLG